MLIPRSSASSTSSKRSSILGGRLSKRSSSVTVDELGHSSSEQLSTHTTPVTPAELSQELNSVPAPPLPTPAPQPNGIPPSAVSSPLERIDSAKSDSSDDSFHSAHSFADAVDTLNQSNPAATTAPPAADTPAGTDASAPAKPPGRHVVIASALMDGPHRQTKPLGKPLTSLTAKDVAMTDASMEEVSCFRGLRRGQLVAGGTRADLSYTVLIGCLQDIVVVWKALHLFMSSRMVEAEVRTAFRMVLAVLAALGKREANATARPNRKSASTARITRCTTAWATPSSKR